MGFFSSKVTCKNCGGSGYIQPYDGIEGMPDFKGGKCTNCNGSGKVEPKKVQCYNRRGKGYNGGYDGASSMDWVGSVYKSQGKDTWVKRTTCDTCKGSGEIFV